jgi:transcriptional regulator with XRE-family HTH domain
VSFADEIHLALTGQMREPEDFPTLVAEMTAYREEIGLSRRGFAKQYGIPESTLRRWERDGVNADAQQARFPQLVRAYRELTAMPGALQRWRNNDMVITVDGVPVRGGSGRTESRELSAAKLRLKPGTGDRVVEAFLKGDDAGAAKAFVKGIGDPWYRQVMFGGWLAENDEDLQGEGYGDETDDGYFVAASAS